MIPDRLQEVLDEDVRSLAAAFGREGHPLYLVGGSVRDAMLGRTASDGAPSDLDFTTSAVPDEIEKIGSEWASTVFLAGKDFGTIGLARNNQTFEITTYRSEMYHDDSRKPTVAFGSSLDEDLARRDFTVNAMALKIPVETGDQRLGIKKRHSAEAPKNRR